METFSALLAFCEGNSPATGEFPSQGPVSRSFDAFFDLRLNKRLSYPTLAREFHGFRMWGKFVFRTLELTDTPTNLANQV